MFLGEYEYRVDEKGRVPLPPKFRAQFKDGIVLASGPENCITAYTRAEWTKLAASMTGGSVAASKMRKLSRALFAGAFSLPVDQQGRVALPAPLREYAGIADEVVVAGLNSYVEIWSKEQWRAEMIDSQEQAWQIIESLERK
jgi:MraZ protein